MAKYDLIPRIAPNLDRHLMFPLLEFLQERQLHEDEAILKAKIELLNHTNMVDYAMDIHKSLYHTDDVPQDMVERRAEVVARLKALEEGAAPLIAFLHNQNAVQELRADKQYNLQMLSERYQIGPQQIEALYLYAKFQFEYGNYTGAADYLYQYRTLCTNPERSLSALWGKLAAEILMQNWDIALEELNRLKEIIDSKSFSSALDQIQNRIWLMHWSLFIFFNHENGRTLIIELFNQDKYLNAIQTNAPHLLRYLATAFVVSKRRQPQFKDFMKVIQQEQYSYEDPITEFLACLFIKYDFNAAQEKMKECEEVILNDPFLGKRAEEGNFSTVPLRDEFLENARLFIAGVKHYGGTTTLAFICRAGILFGSDSRISVRLNDYQIGVKDNAYKIVSVSKRVMACMSGPRQFGRQRLRSLCKYADQPANSSLSVLQLTTWLSDEVKVHKADLPKGRATAFIIAGWDDSGPSIYKVTVRGFHKVDRFAVGGTGGRHAVRVIWDMIIPFWDEKLLNLDIRADYGMDVVRKAVCDAARRDAATGNTANCFLITKDGIQSGFYREKIADLILGGVRPHE